MVGGQRRRSVIAVDLKSILPRDGR